MSNFASGYVKYINHLEQINDAAISDPARMIDEVEDAYHDHLENIVRNITSHHQGVRVVMLSGPSSSGKTTTAHLLRDYLTQYGAKSYIVSLDDFYRGVGLAPRLPDGEYNYESVEALDVEAIKQCLLDIICLLYTSHPPPPAPGLFPGGPWAKRRRQNTVFSRKSLPVFRCFQFSPV